MTTEILAGIGRADPALIVLAGAAGSGKSLLARENWPGRVVSSDALRALAGTGEDDQDATADAFELLHQVVHARMRRKLTTCVDATNVTRDHRAPLIRCAARWMVPAVAVVVWPPLETCLERNTGRVRYVPEDVIRRQYARLTEELPARSEGFARIIITGGAEWPASTDPGGPVHPPASYPDEFPG
jgi:predicted kinase